MYFITDVYKLNITGKYERIMEEDGKLHFHILNYNLELDEHATSSVMYHNLFTRPTGMALQKQLCYNDDECLINAVIERVYPRFVAGGHGVESSDPLHIDAIVADLATFRYGLYNASMIGFKNCEFVKFNNKRLNSYTYFDYGISCPVLTLQARYDLNGIIDSIPVEGRGQCKIVYEKYNISISGKHEKLKDDEGKEHVNILEYKIVSDLKNGRVRDPEYTDLTFNQHDSCSDPLRIIEEMTRDIVMDVFLNKYIQNLKDFYEHNSVEVLHYKYVR
ncbi:unnamed protein product [Spodoptera exigua]|nr:unnamed protein product [Spodoptera exigua]